MCGPIHYFRKNKIKFMMKQYETKFISMLYILCIFLTTYTVMHAFGSHHHFAAKRNQHLLYTEIRYQFGHFVPIFVPLWFCAHPNFFWKKCYHGANLVLPWSKFFLVLPWSKFIPKTFPLQHYYSTHRIIFFHIIIIQIT